MTGRPPEGDWLGTPFLRFERWTPEMLRIINDDFRPDFQSAETMVYRYAGS